MPRRKKSKAALKKMAKQQNKKKASSSTRNLPPQQEAPQQQEVATANPEPEVHPTLSFLSDPNAYIKDFERDIHISNFSLPPLNGGADLISEADIRLVHNHKYGLIGYNGAGKTTFLKYIAAGNCPEIPPYLRIRLVSQEMEGTSQTVLQTVLAADEERALLIQEEERVQGLIETSDVDLTDRLNMIHDRLNYINADTAEARASSVLNGLQFTDRMKNMKTSDLSGGWRMRVSMACALFVEPDLLLLDEPTNHLDVPSVMYLSEYLASYNPEKIVVIVSHDRRFLNDVCSDIIHLTRECKFTYYTGNLDAFERIREEARVNQTKSYERQQNLIKHNEHFVARFKANASRSTQAQSRQKMLDKLVRIEAVVDDLEYAFSFPDPPRLQNPRILTMNEVSFGYFGLDKTRRSYLLRNVTLRVEMGTKIGIIGANGAGKSTLLKMIMEDLRPVLGTCNLSNAVQTGYFSQHHIDTLDFNSTPLQHLKRVFGDASVQQIYSQLGRFHLGEEFGNQRIGTLSGGQKSRLAFCILTWFQPHLLMMDEPTNHLDLPTIDALTNALHDFKGSVIVVSHDQNFVEKVCDEFWAVGNRGVRIFKNFDACRRYTFEVCKPIDVLPREFSTVSVKTNAFSTKSDAEEKTSEKVVVEQAVDRADVFVVDPERAINDGLAKGLSPDGILRHLKGWKCEDGDRRVVDKLGFIMFGDYFDMPLGTSPLDFFGRWSRLISFCIPSSHVANQNALVAISHACVLTAQRDGNVRATQTASFVMVIETMFNLGMVSQEGVSSWVDGLDDQENGNPNAAENILQVQTWLEDLDT